MGFAFFLSTDNGKQKKGRGRRDEREGKGNEGEKKRKIVIENSPF